MFELLRRIGGGSWKVAYTVKDRPDLVALTGQVLTLEAELRMLDQLEGYGLPVLRTFGIHTVTTPFGTQASAILCQRMQYHSKDYGTFDHVLNEETLADFERIDQIMRNKNIEIGDLQFLLNDDGRVAIADPLNIVTYYQTYQIQSWKQRAEAAVKIRKTAMAA